MPQQRTDGRAGDDTADAVSAVARTYVYAYPVVRALQVLNDEVLTGGLPFNVLLTEQPDPGAPHGDPAVLRRSAWLHLGAGPVLLERPAVPADRCASLELVDLMTHRVEGIPPCASGADARRWVLVGPSWDGPLPVGPAVVRARSEVVHLLVRVCLLGADGPGGARAVAQGFQVVPLSSDGTPRATHGPLRRGWDDLDAYGPGFVDHLAQALAVSRPDDPDEQALLARWDTLRSAGRGPADPEVARGAALGAARIRDAIDRDPVAGSVTAHGWSAERLLDRAVRAVDDPFAPGPEVLDTLPIPPRGSPAPRGDRPRRLVFPPGGLPPGRAWSVTVHHEPSGALVRAAGAPSWVGAPDPAIVPGPDGSLVVAVQHAPPPPSATEHVTAWLPAPVGAYRVVIRRYDPAPGARDDGWRPPALVAVD